MSKVGGPGLKVISTSTYGNERVVKVVVSSFQALLDYKPGVDEMTLVVASKSCPEEDIKGIHALCEQLDYTYEGRLADDDGEESSTDDTTGNEGAGSGTFITGGKEDNK